MKQRLPSWLKRRLPHAGQTRAVRELLDAHGLATVCDGAACPNRGECYASGTATFLILGDTCTRHCRFCAIPAGALLPPRADEPEAVAQAARDLKLRYVVITSVTRDDLPDGGADHFAQTIRAVRQACPDARIEVLTPDFQGSVDAIRTVLAAAPDVFNHNIETVPTLYAAVRPEANYQQSLDVLAAAKAENVCLTKSGLMVGLGETDAQVEAVLADLRAVGVDIVTIGQYLAPSDAHVPVARFVEPEQFERWKQLGESMGFAAVASGPFVRSSYHAQEVFETGHDAGHE
jgi:lipoic acid synthetase